MVAKIDENTHVCETKKDNEFCPKHNTFIVLL